MRVGILTFRVYTVYMQTPRLSGYEVQTSGSVASATLVIVIGEETFGPVGSMPRVHGASTEAHARSLVFQVWALQTMCCWGFQHITVSALFWDERRIF